MLFLKYGKVKDIARVMEGELRRDDVSPLIWFKRFDVFAYVKGYCDDFKGWIERRCVDKVVYIQYCLQHGCRDVFDVLLDLPVRDRIVQAGIVCNGWVDLYEDDFDWDYCLKVCCTLRCIRGVKYILGRFEIDRFPLTQCIRVLCDYRRAKAKPIVDLIIEYMKERYNFNQAFCIYGMRTLIKCGYNYIFEKYDIKSNELALMQIYYFRKYGKDDKIISYQPDEIDPIVIKEGLKQRLFSPKQARQLCVANKSRLFDITPSINLMYSYTPYIMEMAKDIHLLSDRQYQEIALTAVQYDFVDVIEYLINKQLILPNFRRNRLIKHSSKLGQYETVKYLLTLPQVDPTAGFQYPIRQSTRKGHLEVLNLLLESSRVDPKAINAQTLHKSPKKEAIMALLKQY